MPSDETCATERQGIRTFQVDIGRNRFLVSECQDEVEAIRRAWRWYAEDKPILPGMMATWEEIHD